MASRPKVTFITHEASRTGAPRVLLTFMQWLNANTDMQISTLATRPGPLLPEFAALGPVVVLDGDWRHFNVVQRGIRLARQLTAGVDRPFDVFVHRVSGTSLWMAKAKQLRRIGECDLIYANSVQSGWGVRSMVSRAPLVSHLHELGDALLDPYESNNVATMCGKAEQIIVPAMAVRDLLITRLGVPASRINVRYPFIDVQAHQANRTARDVVRKELGIPTDAVVVGMSGAFILRKGPDRFIDIATEVLRRTSKTQVYFVWIGGRYGLEYARYMLADIERMGIRHRVRLVEEKADPRPYLAALDIFMLTSRSDPFPLVCLEAAVQAEAPIVCFADAGGMPELVGDDCGIVVPYLDTDAAAEAIHRLVDDAALRTTLGKNAAERVRTNHDVAKAAPAIAAIMKSVLRRNASGRDSGQSAPSPNGPVAQLPLGALESRGEPHRAAPLIHAD